MKPVAASASSESASPGPTTAQAWEALASDLLRWFQRRGMSLQDAQDLRQETFLRVHRSLPTLRDSQALAPWVYRVARNVLVDHVRARRTAEPEVEVPVPATEPEDPDGVVASWLPLFIEGLDEPYRTALRRVELEGWSQQQLAEAEGLSASGARTRVQRARKQLRAALDACCTVQWEGQVIDWKPRDRCGCA